MRRDRSALTFLLLAGLVWGCAPATPAPPQAGAAPTIVDRDWELVSVGTRSNPRGAGNKPVTLRLDSAASRAAGFAGCNRFSAGYVLKGDSLVFQPVISTRMACADGMELETSFLATLSAVTTYQATDSTLTLSGPAGPLLRFRAP